MSRHKILVIDDEKNTREGLQKLLSFDYDVAICEDAVVGLEMVKKDHFDLVLTDLNMPKKNGIEFTREVKKLPNSPLVIMLTAYGSVDVAVQVMKAGAYDYLTKPVNMTNLEMLIKRGLAEISSQRDAVLNSDDCENPSISGKIVGQSEEMNRLMADVVQMAPAKATVLILGESGTGKELVAEALHELSPRKSSPFLAVHCASLNDNLLESELFGHEKGAFTGASSRKIGRIELAGEGTLFLDEIGEISPATQVKLLRVLESRKFERVGGTEVIESKARIVCATNRDLKNEVSLGNFRQDLYFRLSVLNIELPPLRRRPSDIPLLLNHYLAYFNAENGKQIEQFQPEALALLTAYQWPGNIRELKNMVERMVVMSKGGDLSVGEIPDDIRQHLLDDASPQSTEVKPEKTLKLSDNEEELILDALDKCRGNVTHASALLGVSRRTLQRKMKKYGLSHSS
jgi:DNA-binding NtrC family response regulator